MELILGETLLAQLDLVQRTPRSAVEHVEMDRQRESGIVSRLGIIESNESAREEQASLFHAFAFAFQF